MDQVPERAPARYEPDGSKGWAEPLRSCLPVVPSVAPATSVVGVCECLAVAEDRSGHSTILFTFSRWGIPTGAVESKREVESGKFRPWLAPLLFLQVVVISVCRRSQLVLFT